MYRIQVTTHPENLAEQKSLEKAGFRLEGVIRGSEFRAGQFRDGYLYSRLRDDPAPELGNGSVTGTGFDPVGEPLAD